VIEAQKDARWQADAQRMLRMSDEYEAAQEEIERLRKALREIVNKDRTGFARGALAYIAREALRNHEQTARDEPSEVAVRAMRDEDWRR